MLTAELVIRIPGHPAPKGSLRCRRDPSHRLIEDNKRTKPWRDSIAAWVTRKWPTDQYADKGQPIGAEVTFTLDRPRYHYGTGRNAQTIKERYTTARPVGHDTGDADKLLRLVLDALQDTDVLPDDCAVVETTARKAYTGGAGPDVLGYPGVVIRLYPVP